MSDDRDEIREEVEFPADVDVPDEVEERLRGRRDDEDEEELEE
jgi:hypothetical protein